MKAIAKIALALGCLIPAAARADGLSIKDTAVAAVRSGNCYVAAFGSGKFVNTDANAAGVTLPLGADNMGIGARVGCDAIQNNWLVGVFGDYTWNRANSDITAGGATLVNVPFGNEWSVGMRAGVFATPSTLLYGKLAYTVAQDQNLGMMGSSFSLSGVKGGTIGGGVETALTKNVTLFLEYDRTGFDTTKASGLPISFDTVENKVLAGLTYHFGSGQ